MKNVLEEIINRELLTSVVILSYNRLEDLKNNLESLYEKTDLPFEVIIFDNNSEEETKQYLKTLKGKTKKDGNGLIKVIYNDSNLGCSLGRREAIKHASGDYIYTIDNDMTYGQNWLESLIQRIKESSEIGAVSSKIVFPNKKVQLNGGKLILEEDYFATFVEIDQGKNENDLALEQKMDCDWLCGGATLFKREVVEKIKHAEGYLNGFEDYDYSFQIVDNGYRIVNCPNSTVYHHHISFDKEKQEKEKKYLSDRWNAKRTWISLIYFIERTGINPIKHSGFYKWIESDGTKPFLEWGTVEEVEHGYQDLFPEKKFSELNNKELKKQFDYIIEENIKIRQKKSIKEGYSSICEPIIEELADELQQGFSNYNRYNLSRHLDWVIKKEEIRGKLSQEDISHLRSEFSKYVLIKDKTQAEQFYRKLEEKLSEATI